MGRGGEGFFGAGRVGLSGFTVYTDAESRASMLVYFVADFPGRASLYQTAPVLQWARSALVERR